MRASSGVNSCVSSLSGSAADAPTAGSAAGDFGGVGAVIGSVACARRRAVRELKFLTKLPPVVVSSDVKPE